MKTKMMKVLLAVGLGWTWLGGARASASEFEVVADSFTTTQQVNQASVTYMGAKVTAPGNPNTATQLTTPGAMYFDGSNYKVWERSLSQWVNVATGTVSGSQVSGSGTANTVTKWTAAGTVGNSNITDNGTVVTIAGADMAVNGTGNVTFTNTGANGVDILGFRVTKSGNVTTLRNGSGGALVNIK